MSQASPWLTTTATSSAAEQPLASLPPMATHDRRLGSPVMARKPKRRQQALGHSANLQICFMPDDLLDDDDLVSTTSATMASCDRLSAGPGIDGLDVRLPSPVQPKSLPASSGNAAGSVANGRQKCVDDSAQQDDFWRKQARLQAEARVALAQACHMAKMQMEVERQRKKNSPISDMISLPVSCSGHRRLSRSLLTRINLEELNAIQTSLIMEVKKLNEQLVTNLMMRDELHMEQDSMLVDLEDLTRYLSAKEEILRVRGPPMNHNKTEAIKMQSKQNNKFSLKSLVKF
ncbi:unnamed protein product [Notodromas monacha]|uniref:Schwannomin interacting protein 1 C-terminal domain-containing protein n=1 Tax=Notodromas monacha TaxID=399045 RepID=A0A7R9BVB2_9CRUS|nr:unnamed protein product [Notodromas monacha]CAG0921280.1 unnamed protein product [Notodromas monacha]